MNISEPFIRRPIGTSLLALGSGTGAELRRPLGITIVGGLILSQVLTLYTTPVIYLYMDRLTQLGKKKEPAPDEPEHANGHGHDDAPSEALTPTAPRARHAP